ncbi:hypothetical protein [Paraburkholderia oxyphila]|uniref:hypothetical protein n=1 Tax=Paraburkholderia oxyphila TaxID=614212 RepID=UPI000480CFAD|nr:hypothetical protein [Paraburkholderia oxyphila]
MRATPVHYDRLWTGSGNAERLTFDLSSNVATVSNDRGPECGTRLWHLRPVRETPQFTKATQQRNLR